MYGGSTPLKYLVLGVQLGCGKNISPPSVAFPEIGQYPSSFLDFILTAALPVRLVEREQQTQSHPATFHVRLGIWPCPIQQAILLPMVHF